MSANERASVGVDLIRQSELAKLTKQGYIRSWREWERVCEASGVDAVDASWEDVVEWLRSGEMTSGHVRNVRSAIGFVYRALGKAPPTHDQRVKAEIYGAERFGPERSYHPEVRQRILYAQSDYRAWCERHGVTGSRESGEQVARYLRELSAEFGYGHVKMMSLGVSRCLEAEGYPSTDWHPAVLEVLRECRQRGSQPGVGAPRYGTKRITDQERWPRQWKEWCASQGVDPDRASPEDAMRYLASLEPQRDAAKRVGVLSKQYQGQEGVRDPFSTPEVLEWRREYRKRKANGELPPVPRRKTMSEVVAAFGVPDEPVVDVPKGLTRDEVERVSKTGIRRVSTRTVQQYGQSWARFRAWFEDRELKVEDLRSLHVKVYVEELAEHLQVTSLKSVVNGLAYGFEMHGLDQNPAASKTVMSYLRELELDRKERPEQMTPLRLADSDVLVQSAAERRPHERSKTFELRRTTEVAMFGTAADGLLRGNECAGATWKHINRMPDGTGSLLLPWSKTDRVGNGEYTYLSRSTLGHLDALRELKKSFGIKAGDDDLLFGAQAQALSKRIRASCQYAGLEGSFGVRSFRIGMAQELALAGFGLTMIMQAGRWEDPRMPRYYIRELRVHENAVAELHRMTAEGRHRVTGESKGYDIVSAFHWVKYGR